MRCSRLPGWRRSSPITRACAHLGLARSSYYERPASKAKADEPVVEVLNQVLAKHGRWGFRLCFDWMRNQGYAWNHKRVWRIYKEMGLHLPRRTKKRIPKMPKVPLVAPQEPNSMWALDFMYDTLHYGRPFRTLNVIDESNREVLAIEIDISLPAARVVRMLEQLKETHGLPKAIRLDNGSELRSVVFMGWCVEKGIELKFIQPGKPQQNAFIERFNRTYRHEVPMPIYLKTSGRSVTLQKAGSRFITKKDPTSRWEEYQLETTEQRQKTIL